MPLSWVQNKTLMFAVSLEALIGYPRGYDLASFDLHRNLNRFDLTMTSYTMRL